MHCVGNLLVRTDRVQSMIKCSRQLTAVLLTGLAASHVVVLPATTDRKIRSMVKYGPEAQSNLNEPRYSLAALQRTMFTTHPLL